MLAVPNERVSVVCGVCGASTISLTPPTLPNSPIGGGVSSVVSVGGEARPPFCPSDWYAPETNAQGGHKY